MPDSDFEHWSSKKDHDYVYVPKYDQPQKPAAKVVYRTADSDSEYEHWPSRKSRPIKKEEEIVYYALEESPPPRRTKKTIVERVIYKDDPIDEEVTTYYYYPPAKKARSPTPPPKQPEPKIWRGRTKEEVKEDNARIAAKYDVPPPPEAAKKKSITINKRADDGIWVIGVDGELTLKTFREVKRLADAEKGKWKINPAETEHPYFIMSS